MIYEPVYRIDKLRVEQGRVGGWAYPKSGPRCCALGLFIGSTLVFAARCDRFDREAAVHGVRDGWCGFAFDLDPEFFVQADVCEIRCLSSGSQLGSFQLGRDSVRDTKADAARRRSLQSLIERNDDEDVTLDCYLNVMERMASQRSSEQTVTFLFQFFLRRLPDPEGMRSFTVRLDRGEPYREVLRSMVESEEFGRWKDKPLPNIFSDQFPESPIFAPVE